MVNKILKCVGVLGEFVGYYGKYSLFVTFKVVYSLSFALILLGCVAPKEKVSINETALPQSVSEYSLPILNINVDQFYSLSTTEFDNIKNNIQVSPPSVADWENLFSVLKNRPPIEWKFNKIKQLAVQGECGVVEYPNLGFQAVRYLKPNSSEGVKTGRNGEQYISPSSGRISSYLDEYVKYDLPPLGTHICIEDYKNRVISSYLKTAIAPTKRENGQCDVFVSSIAQHLSTWPTCRTKQGDDQHYYKYAGKDKLCKISQYWADAQFKCIPKKNIRNGEKL